MNPIEELQVLINVAKAHGQKVLSVDVEKLQVLVSGYVQIEERIERLEVAVFEYRQEAGDFDYAKGM